MLIFTLYFLNKCLRFLIGVLTSTTEKDAKFDLIKAKRMTKSIETLVNTGILSFAFSFCLTFLKLERRFTSYRKGF